MTGYPADLLDPDLDLEADLGVDTVKQAEVFAAVRTQWNLERDDTLQLREFPTLNHVAGWVRTKIGMPRRAVRRSGHHGPAAPAAPAAPVAAGSRPRTRCVDDASPAIVAEMTGYPADLLDPDLDLEADLGVDTVKQAEVFAAVRDPVEPRTRRHPPAARVPHPEPRRRLGPHQARRRTTAPPQRHPLPARPAPAPTTAPATATAAADTVGDPILDTSPASSPR